jgi:mannitol-1-phosphate/altronate dehydrogenase
VESPTGSRPGASAPAGLDGPATLDFYRSRKVSILNGAHRSTALAAYLYGLDTVEQCTLDATVRRFMEQAIFHEIIPAVSPNGKENATGNTAELNRFARETLERFANPYVKHQLLAITLNSVSKFKTRVLPSIFAYREKFNRAPPALCCSLAALLAFYRGAKDSETQGARPGGKKELYPIRDDAETLRRFAALWAEAAVSGDSGANGGSNPMVLQQLVHAALSSVDWWGEDLTAYPDIEKAVAGSLSRILKDGMAAALTAAGQQAATEPAAAGALP